MTIRCHEHGEQDETFVCQHIVTGLNKAKHVGFFTASGPTKKRPDAWCSECNERVARSGGEWVGAALENVNAQLLCGICYDQARDFYTTPRKSLWARFGSNRGGVR